MAARDQIMRKEAQKTGRWHTGIDRKNTNLLKAILKKFGWPTISMVGRKASRSAWLLAQHADHDVAFQKRVLSVLERIYAKNNDIDPANIAFLKDRILVAERKRQIFGTQFYVNKAGTFGPRPIRSMGDMKKLRKEYNLPPFSEYVASIKSYKPFLKERIGK